MTQIEITDAKTRLTELIDRVKGGEEIVPADDGKPVVRLSRAFDSPRRRGLGIFKGQIWMADDFNAPLTDEELKEWGL